MPSRTPRPTKKTKSHQVIGREQGPGRVLPEHLPQAGEILELTRGDGYFGVARPLQQVYVRVLHYSSWRLDADVCGVRRVFYVDAIAPATDGHVHCSATVSHAYWIGMDVRGAS